MLDTEYPIIVFTAHDRCDACGAQAYTQAEREDMPAALLFCLHHRKRHIDALEQDGWTIVDDYEAISRLADNQYAGV